MERLLFEASVEGSVASLLILLQKDQLILDRVVALTCYDDTCLHVASMLGHIEFVKEILARRPGLASEFNSQRYLPLHIASAKGHLEIVKALVSTNPDTCLVQDSDGRNPLHLAAIKGRDEVLKELMRTRPHAARATVQRGETILHLCVRHNQLEALKFLVETMGDHEFVNSKDVDGNTILHLAVADKQLETINFLLLNTTIEVNATNANGDTAMDVLAQGRRDVKDVQIIQSLGQAGACEEKKTESSSRQAPTESQRDMILPDLVYHERTLAAPNSRKHVNNHDDWLERKRSTLMVVASLIATMAFQAGINPPQGVWQDDLTVDSQGNHVDMPHQAGNSVMATQNPEEYSFFLVCNTVSFVSSLSIILLLISGLPFFKRRFFIWILMVIMWMATTATSLTFSVSIWALTPHDQIVLSVVAAIVLVWIGLMALLLIGHTIRLFVKGRRKLLKLIFRSS